MQLFAEPRVALVAASSKGLGRAVAEALAAEGATVLVNARHQKSLDDTCAAIERAGGRVHGIQGDVANADDRERMIAEAIRVAGRIDILVTNSGGPPSGAFDRLWPEAWDQAYALLLASAVGLVRSALPGMRERRWGRILTITSIAARRPVDGLMLSNSLRAAVAGFARSLANEVAADGVTVNNLLPGYTRTERVEDLARQMAAAEGCEPATIAARWESAIPMRRLGEPHEFGALAAFLASDHASYITGQSIAVDGGWS